MKRVLHSHAVRQSKRGRQSILFLSLQLSVWSRDRYRSLSVYQCNHYGIVRKHVFRATTSLYLSHLVKIRQTCRSSRSLKDFPAIKVSRKDELQFSYSDSNFQDPNLRFILFDWTFLKHLSYSDSIHFITKNVFVNKIYLWREIIRCTCWGQLNNWLL